VVIDQRSFEIRTVDGGDADRALALATAVWGTPPLDGHMLRALELAGSYVSVAEAGDELLGMCLGIVGIQGDHRHLHSHLLAVDPAHRRAGVGRALKRHQRQWCLDRGIPVVSWTFDPLLHANARFNLQHLGARAPAYLVALYGEMDDDINRGDASDRLLATWDLRSPRAVHALDAPLDVPALDGAEPALVDAGGRPEARDTDSPLRLVAAPADAVALRGSDPDLAAEWRHAVRSAMQHAYADGLVPVAVTDDRCYVFAAEALP
jgi:predicted GNAT superfamily acetyltransferase